MKLLIKFVIFALISIITASVHDWDEPTTLEPTKELTYLIYNVTFNETRDHNLFFQVDIRHILEYYTKIRVVVGDDNEEELMSSATIIADATNNILDVAVFVPNAKKFYCFFNIFGKTLPSTNLRTCNGKFGMTLTHVATNKNPLPAKDISEVVNVTDNQLPSPTLKGLSADEYEFFSSETYPITYTNWDFKNCKEAGLIISVSEGVNVDSVLQMDVNDYVHNVTQT